jgi:putative phosphoesterase
MKIGVMSDTHGNIDNLEKAVEVLKNLGAEKLIHLGDNYTDVAETGEDMMQVPGVFSDEYQKPSIPNRRIENFNGWRVLLTHTVSAHENDLPDDIKPEECIEEKTVDMVLYGHTHIPSARQKHGVVYVNPGHLKDEDKKGYPPTCACINLEEQRAQVKIYDVTTLEIVQEAWFTKGAQ